MRTLFLLFLFCFAQALVAQVTAPHYDDVVHLLGEPKQRGYVKLYDYGEVVVLEKRDGTTERYPWKRVKRVTFQEGPVRGADSQEPDGPGENFTPAPLPLRRYRHQLLVAPSFSRGARGEFNRFRGPINVGFGASYHLVYDLGSFRVGGGLDYAGMNANLRERLVSATGLVEYTLGPGPLRPLARLDAGPSYPVGGGLDEEQYRRRYLSLLLQPSLGVEITSLRDPQFRLLLDLGYRFATHKVDLDTANLEVETRISQYRRLVFRAGIRF